MHMIIHRLLGIAVVIGCVYGAWLGLELLYSLDPEGFYVLFMKVYQGWSSFTDPSTLPDCLDFQNFIPCEDYNKEN